MNGVVDIAVLRVVETTSGLVQRRVSDDILHLGRVMAEVQSHDGHDSWRTVLLNKELVQLRDEDGSLVNDVEHRDQTTVDLGRRAQELKTTLLVIDDKVGVLDKSPRRVIWDFGSRVGDRRVRITGKGRGQKRAIAVDASDVGSLGTAHKCHGR